MENGGNYPYHPTYSPTPQPLDGHFHAHLPWDTADLCSAAPAAATHARSVSRLPQPVLRPLRAGGGGGGGEGELGAPHVRADRHLACLQLGKRRYFESDRAVGDRRCKTHHGGGGGATAVPRCQVEGCHVALGDARDYHRRHKVCEAHSKAPRVVVLGLEQRFCQQCSRYRPNASLSLSLCLLLFFKDWILLDIYVHWGPSENVSEHSIVLNSESLRV